MVRLLRSLQFGLVVVCRTMIYRGIQLRGVGRHFLLYDGEYTMSLDETLLGLLLYRVFFDLRGERCDSCSLGEFRIVLTRTHAYLVGHL